MARKLCRLVRKEHKVKINPVNIPGVKRGGVKMEQLVKISTPKMRSFGRMMDIIQETIQEKELTEMDIRKSFGMKKYEK